MKDSPTQPSPEMPLAPLESAAPPGKSTNKKKWRRRLLVAFLVVSCLYLFRVPILRFAAGLLIIDEAPHEFDCLLLFEGTQRFGTAARLCQEGAATRLVYIERAPYRLVRMGLIPSLTTLTRLRLRALEVPEEKLTILEGACRTDWDRARRLRAWLKKKPDVTVVVLCDQFGSRRVRRIFDRVLGSEYAHRVQVSPLAEPTHDPSNWWERREGLIDFFNSAVALVFVYIIGEDREEWREWDPKEYDGSQ